tara:strand:+ start:8092 stop:9948 length:1857 start_codon:yes stop_codon:yes gene_type:complete
MAFYAKDIYTADGSTQSFAVTYPFISRDHVSVTADGVAATFTWVNDGQITITSPAALDGEILIIKRNTSPSSLLVDYVDGSNLTETDLDLDSKQAFFLAQENNDEQGLIDVNSVATSTHIFVADGTDFNSVAVTGDVTITNAGVTAIGADKITGANLADNACNSEHYTDGSIDTVHIADVNVTTAKIANDAITGAKIALFDDAYEATTTHILVADGTDFDNVAMTGDIGITNAGVTSIASGVVVNADVNADAAIDATKIHNGAVTNTEFSYLDGVTSAIQTQITDITAGAVTIIDDDNLTLRDNATITKKAQFQCSGISADTTRTFTFPDANGTLLLNTVEDTSPQLGGDLDCNGAQIQWSKGSDVASATALPLLTDGNYFDVTGTATITSFNATGGAGTQVKLHFDGACTLTHNSDLILPGGANIVTAAGDEADFIEFAAGDYRCTSYTKASGLAVIRPAASATAAGIVELATDAETGTGTDAARATTPAGVASIVGSVLQAYDADTLKADTADVLTAGYACTVHNAGTKASGTYTPDEADGNMQKAVNGGAHTLAVPANDCTMVIQYTNNASAGTITTSAYTIVDGDDLTTTNGHDFFFYITNSDAFTLLTVKALQ